MDLKGAQIRNIYSLCQEINGTKETRLSVNIPHYQRPYKWGNDQITNLFKDFKKNKETEDASAEYFVGSVVTVVKENCHDIIDGQQRVTTIFLLNYLKFLLLRAYVEELLLSKKGSKIESTFKNLEKASKLLGIKKELSVAIEKSLEEIEEADDEEKDELWENILEVYHEKLYLPVKNFNDEKAYKKAYGAELKDFFEDEELALRYSRKTYNDKLKTAMANVWIRMTNAEGPELRVVDDECLEDSTVEQYINALKCEFDILLESAINEKNSMKTCAKMIDLIDVMLENIQFCVIVTGNERDAYTLFEVLNDRSLQVDDLDLIKNLFFKKYCLLSKETEKEIDKTIEILDNIWVNETFADIGTTQTKLIAYLGTIYLTADESVVTKKTEKYREVIEKQYFNKFYQEKKYTRQNVINDFRIFQMIKIITDSFELAYQKKAEKAISVECQEVKSITCKTMHLLNALELIGVMPIITNFIVKTFIDKQMKKGKSDIDIEEFKSFVEKLKDKDNENVEEFKNIHKTAYNLWVVVLLSNDYHTPREMAKKIIEKVNVRENHLSLLEITTTELSALKDQYSNWTEKWQYKGSNDLKIKLLFLDLLKTDKTDDALKYTATVSVFSNTKTIQLDHLEPNSISNVDLSKRYYFKPEDENASRDSFVNSLGNFMLLDGKNNNDKDNRPLYEALTNYRASGSLGKHWLVEEIATMLEDDNYSTLVDGIRVPNEKFFTERKKRLQKYFLAILLKAKDDTVIRV